MSIIEIIALIIIIFFLFSLVRSFYSTFLEKPGVGVTPKIHKRDYQKDVVYLYQFPRTATVPNLSSFCLKIETLLRAFKIPHEIIETGTLRSRNGTLPFIELNGEHIPDSDLIEHRLRIHFKIPNLPSEKEARAVAISRLADNHLLSIIIKYKSAEPEWFDGILRGVPGPQIFKNLLKPIVKALFDKKVHERTSAAIGAFTEEEAEVLCHRDLQAIQDSISGKYLFGDKLTPADCTVFGEIASAYYPFPNKFTRIIDSHYPKIREYCDRIIEEVYPDDFVLN